MVLKGRKDGCVVVQLRHELVLCRAEGKLRELLTVAREDTSLEVASHDSCALSVNGACCYLALKDASDETQDGYPRGLHCERNDLSPLIEVVRRLQSEVCAFVEVVRRLQSEVCAFVELPQRFAEGADFFFRERKRRCVWTASSLLLSSNGLLSSNDSISTS